MAHISIRNLKKQFGQTVAVSDFSLDIADGELVTFLGPSGCGKTTTLRMVAGFIAPTAGSIHIGDTDVTRLPVHKRETGMVFQRYALFPHMTVEQNVAFGLEMHKVDRRERQTRIQEVLSLVRMSHLAQRYPRELSGGQQQRVAIARALAIRPRAFLLDEPLSNLDAKLRLEVREEIRTLQQELGLSTIFVTHDQEEALAISDRMAVMFDGKVQQVGTPEELYERPANLFVASFLGRMNFLPGSHAGSTEFIAASSTSIKADGLTASTRQLGLRPERIRLSPTPQAGFANQLAGAIDNVSYLGDQLDIRFRAASGLQLIIQAPNLPEPGNGFRCWQPGMAAVANFHAHDCIAFSEAAA
ncbi:ABC transporter ATP-binding protein [Paracandidimonas soli]|uniref:Putative spermidine/putrescine transport system ATP-binding protein n=1 Tax=Paracandidimonas soli TaxID=1917182 RepID=A0A4R3VFD5_9BURK|nr:ABC transporter ATP-binding protein [Paracandidimonas soli]TCV01515.1 putative spermidine/putrescine transport system ATP-binding protein [Paracandidimonas soli]